MSKLTTYHNMPDRDLISTARHKVQQLDDYPDIQDLLEELVERFEQLYLDAKGDG